MREAEDSGLFAFDDSPSDLINMDNDENGVQDYESTEDDVEIKQEEKLSEMLNDNLKLNDVEQEKKSSDVADASRISALASAALASLQQKQNSDVDDLDLDLDDVDPNNINSDDDYLSDD
jgi:hypothetical protein